MKFVYVLISTEKDYYYEQCFVSASSLRYRMPAADIIILTDFETESTLMNTRRKIYDLNVQIIPVEFPATMNNRIRSRMLKTKMPEYIKGDFMYIDIDTVIADDLSQIEVFQGDLAFVLDKHVHLSNHYSKKYITSNAKKMNYHADHNDCHWNGGVCLVRDTESNRKFFELWNALYKECLEKGIEIDQCSLNEANFRMNGIIKELPGIWNVQLCSGIQYIYEGKILHYLGYQPLAKESKYFNTLPFLLCDGNYLDEIKEQGNITDSVDKIIKNPKSAFKNVHVIPDDCVLYPLLFSNHVRILKFLYVKMRHMYNLFEKIYGSIFKKIYGRV